MKRFGLVLFFTLPLFSFHRPLWAEDSVPLRTQIEALASQYEFGEVDSGIYIQDLNSGEVVFSKNHDLLLNPASNTKILTALAALSLFGPDFRFKTQLLGTASKEKGTLETLTLKGWGDPYFSTERLEEMVRTLKTKGIRRVRDVGVDGSYFDGEDFPGQMQGRQRDAVFNCNVGAVSIDHNLLEVEITPGEKLRTPATVEAKPPLPLIPLENEVLTSRKKGRIIVKSSASEEDLKVYTSGRIALSSGPMLYRVSIHHPLKLAGLRLLEALKNQGIEAPSEIPQGCVRSKEPVLVESLSPSLSEILQEMNKNSDNFISEQITKSLGAQFGGLPGSTEKGVRVILKRLKELGIKTEGIELENGSGLSKKNRLRAKTLAEVLKKAYDDAKIRSHFMPSLSVMGVDGTLRRKFRNSDLAGRFLGKTGTLAGVSSLSGYVFPRNPDKVHPYIFSFILNGRGKDFRKEKEFSHILLEVLMNE